MPPRKKASVEERPSALRKPQASSVRVVSSCATATRSVRACFVGQLPPPDRSQGWGVVANGRAAKAVPFEARQALGRNERAIWSLERAVESQHLLLVLELKRAIEVGLEPGPGGVVELHGKGHLKEAGADRLAIHLHGQPLELKAEPARFFRPLQGSGEQYAVEGDPGPSRAIAIIEPDRADGVIGAAGEAELLLRRLGRGEEAKARKGEEGSKKSLRHGQFPSSAMSLAMSVIMPLPHAFRTRTFPRPFC